MPRSISTLAGPGVPAPGISTWLIRSSAGPVAVVMLCIAAHANAADEPGATVVLPPVQVIGTTPLPGFGAPLRDVPANVQIFDERLFTRLRPLSLTQFLDLNANSVGAASGQGNPFQQSLNFRGFAASPLLGTPQGMSVFQDGVRINEAFGDVVNWDLLPRSAISGIQLIPGSVPAFGLNTLGGALAIYTKSGAEYPGTAAEISAGSFGRRTLQVEFGAAGEPVDAFATANLSDENGWALHNASRIRQFFGKLRFRGDRSGIEVSTTLADNALHGAQTLPVSFLDQPRSPYTYPDVNENRLAFVVLNANRLVGDGHLFDANVYYRRFRNTNVSSNVNDDFGKANPEPGSAESNPATNDRARIDEASYGGSVQWTTRRTLAGHEHQYAIGASANGGITHFSQASQPALFTRDRATVGDGPYADTTIVALRNSDAGIYASDALALSEAWTLTGSARYDTARVAIEDRSGQDSALNGAHGFARLDPALGITFNPTQSFTAYATYNEGMRAPTPIELTCADPDAPCKLPNEFLADPPLAKVVSSTIEAGARGRWRTTTWSAAIYRTDLRNDLAFIASGTGATNAGYFQNIGRTRRQGVELGVAMHVAPLTVMVRYNAIDARYRSTFDAASPANSEADAAGGIIVRTGDRLPGIPTQSAKLRVDWDAAPGISVGASLVTASSQYANGDENNADRGGRVPGYLVANLDAQYAITKRATLFVQVDNLFNRQYANFGLLGTNVFTGPQRSFGPAVGVAPVDEQFRALGAPRGVWVGIRVASDAPAAKP